MYTKNTKKDDWMYLASVMKLHSKKSLGHAYDVSMAAGLAMKTVNNICLSVKDIEGILFHTALRVQYTSHEFEKYLKEKVIIHSFDRKGIYYDNAGIKAFYFILKKK